MLYCIDSIEKLREKTNLKIFIEKNKIKCKKCGGELLVIDKYDLYKCENEKCENVGNIFTALMDFKNWDFRETVEYIAKMKNFKLEECIIKGVKNIDDCKTCKLHERRKNE